LFAPLVIANGCVAVSNYFVSKPEVDTNEIRITQNGEIKLDGAVITIRPANAILKTYSEGLLFPFVHHEPEQYRFSSPYYKGSALSSVNYFILELIISPANNHLVFIPKTVILRTQKDGDISPVSYKKLTVQRGWYSLYYPKYIFEICQQDGEIDGNIDRPIQISSEGDMCLAVKYNVTPPDPRTSFSIQIKGLNVNGQDINVPIIKFEPGIYRY
jgi:hypothetical protein